MTFRKALVHANLANQLTFLRLVAIPFFVLAILDGRFGVALVLFVGASVTDLLDGLIARYLAQQTLLGAYLDPAADKLLLTSAFVLLTEYPSMFQGLPLTHRLPLSLTILTISRDVLIVCVALVLFLAYHQTRFRPSIWGKLTALSESATIGFFLLANSVERGVAFLTPLVTLTLGLTLISGFHYLGRTIRRIGTGDLPGVSRPPAP